MADAFGGYVCMSAAIDAAVEARSMLAHPFYRAWERGELSREALRAYAMQYFHHVEAFPRAVSAVHTNCPDAAGRRLACRQLIDQAEAHAMREHPCDGDDGLVLHVDVC